MVHLFSEEPIQASSVLLIVNDALLGHDGPRPPIEDHC